MVNIINDVVVVVVVIEVDIAIDTSGIVDARRIVVIVVVDAVVGVFEAQCQV